MFMPMLCVSASSERHVRSASIQSDAGNEVRPDSDHFSNDVGQYGTRYDDAFWEILLKPHIEINTRCGSFHCGPLDNKAPNGQSSCCELTILYLNFCVLRLCSQQSVPIMKSYESGAVLQRNMYPKMFLQSCNTATDEVPCWHCEPPHQISAFSRGHHWTSKRLNRGYRAKDDLRRKEQAFRGNSRAS